MVARSSIIVSFVMLSCCHVGSDDFFLITLNASCVHQARGLAFIEKTPPYRGLETLERRVQVWRSRARPESERKRLQIREDTKARSNQGQIESK